MLSDVEWFRTKAPQRTRLGAFVVTALAIATFGPYVLGGLRTEQIVLYGLAVPLVIFLLPFISLRGGLRFLIPWSLYVIVALLGAIFPSRLIPPHLPGELFAGLDNILAPLALMLLIWVAVAISDAARLLLRVCKIVAVAMAANGVVSIIATRVDISPLMRPFWSTADGGTVAELAAQLGRYSGIFNQPAEAGALYGLAGIAAIYAWKQRPALLAVVLVLITVGGMISVSKVFVIGGLPFVLAYWVWTQRTRVAAVVFAIGIAILGVMQSGLLDSWIGFNYLARLINPEGDGGFLAFYTAGRLAQGSTFTNLVDSALAYSPLTGVGAGGWAVPYDGAVAEALVVGGIIGLILYGTVIVAMFTLSGRGAPKETRLFAFFIAVVTAGACLGFSPLTANRVSTIVWLMIALLVLVRRAESGSDGDDESLAGGRSGTASYQRVR